MSDIANLQIRIDSSGVVTATNSLKGLADQGGQTQGVMDAQETQSKSLTTSFLEYATALGAAYFSFDAITKAVEASLSDYKEAGQNTAVLAGALKASGDNSEESLQALKDMGSEIQSMTGYSADAATKAEGLLISVGHLDSDGIQQILPHIADLAQGLGISLPQAAEMVAKSLDGSRNMLSRYGIEVDKSADSSTRLDEITKGLQDKFGGIAQTVGEDAVGSMLKLENANKELSAQLGESFARSAQPIMDFLTKLKLAWADELKAEDDYLTSHGKVMAGVASGQDIINDNVHKIGTLKEQYDALKGSSDGYRDSEGNLTAAYGDSLKSINDQIVALEKQNLQLSNASVYQKQHIDFINKAAKADEDAEVADKAWRDSILSSLDMVSGAEARTGKQDDQALINDLARDKAERDSKLKMLDEISGAEQTTQKEIDVARQTEHDLEVARLNVLTTLAIDSSKSIFEQIGQDIAANSLSWKSFGEAAIHAIGKIVSALGDQLAADAAGKLAEAIANSLDPLMAWAAPGEYAAAAEYGVGSAAAWTAGAALSAVKLAGGGDFTVPPGYPNDSFTAKLTSGEHVRVDPVGAQPQSGGDTTVNFMIDGQALASWTGKWIEKGSRNKTFIMHKGVLVP